MYVFLLAGHAGTTQNAAVQHGSAAEPVQPEPVPISWFRPGPGERRHLGLVFLRSASVDTCDNVRIERDVT